MDRLKETIFNVLGNVLVNATVLDLFSGSGSLGLESLSRGAKRVIFVEKNPWGYKCIQKNLCRLELVDRSNLITKSVDRAIRTLEKKGEIFSIIFLDPPYNKGLVKKILNQLDHSVILTPHTQIIVHHSRQEKLPESLERIEVLREKRIGQACLSFLSGKAH